MRITIEELQNLPPKEREEMMNKLAKRAFAQFILLHTLKWVLIITITRSLKKVLEKKLQEEEA